MPMRNITKWRDGNHHAKGLEENVGKMSVLPKMIYRVDAIPLTIPSTFL